jgi:hypothetical protein
LCGRSALEEDEQEIKEEAVEVRPRTTAGGRQPVPGSGAEVTQAMLAEYVELSGLVHRREELRQAILDLLESGRPVEGGPVTVAVRRVERRQLTAAGLRAVIGDENLRVFMAEIPPTVYRELVVRDTGWGATRREKTARR